MLLILNTILRAFYHIRRREERVEKEARGDRGGGWGQGGENISMHSKAKTDNL